jgi:Arm domain-containing DNA-binding protein
MQYLNPRRLRFLLTARAYSQEPIFDVELADIGQIGPAATTKTRQGKKNLLTATKVTSKKAPGCYSDGKGLYLIVRSGDSKQWVFMYRRDGRLMELGFGSPDEGVTLTMARKLRDEAWLIMASGRNALEVRR